MLKKILERRSERLITLRKLLANALVRKIEDEGEVEITHTLARKFGSSRREVFRAACALVMQEKMHLVMNNDGSVCVVSNHRFEQSIRASAASYGTIRMNGSASIEPLSVTDPESEAIFVDDFMDDLVLLDPAIADDLWDKPGKHASGRWKRPITVDSADFEVRDGRDSRKTLPSRERDPWFDFDKIEFPSIDDTKKK